MYDKLLKDLGISEEDLKSLKPRKVLESMIQGWFEAYPKDISEEAVAERSAIVKYAKDNGLAFMCPADWLEKACSCEEPLQKAEIVDHDKYVFNIVTGKVLAPFFRSVLKVLESTKKGEKDLVVKFYSGEEELPDKLTVVAGDIDSLESTEDYLRTEEVGENVLEKADMNVSFRGSDESVQAIIDVLKKGAVLVLDPDGENPVTKEIAGVELDEVAISEPDKMGKKTLFVSGKGLSEVADLFTKIGEIGNTGHTFSIVVDGEDTIEWDGDGSDYVENVELKKAVGNYPKKEDITDTQTQEFVQEPFKAEPFTDKMALIQNRLSPFGAMPVEVNFAGSPFQLQVFMDFDIDETKIEEILSEFDLKLDGRADLRASKVLFFVHKNTSEPVSVEGLDLVAASLGSLPEMNKAKKGTPGYDEWLAKYQDKRKKKEPESGKLEFNEFGLTKREVADILEGMKFAESRQRNEEELEEMLRPKK